MIDADLLLPVGLGLAGVVTGLAWRIPSVGRFDASLFQCANQARWPCAIDQAMGLLRVAGTTPFFLAAVVLVAFLRPSWALGLALAAAAAELLTKALKLAIHRPRPFAVDAGVVLRLRRPPIDPSFPSADAMRAAFLSGLTLAGSSWPWWVVGLALLTAMVIGMGRVRSGAHYPLDVTTGSAIGLGAVLAWTSTL